MVRATPVLRTFKLRTAWDIHTVRCGVGEVPGAIRLLLLHNPIQPIFNGRIDGRYVAGTRVQVGGVDAIG